MSESLQRLDSLLRSRGVGTKRQAVYWVEQGAVYVNGIRAEHAVDYYPSDAEITLNGVIVPYRAPVTMMMNKPACYLCGAATDRYPSVLSLLPEEYREKGLFTVGRLDADTTGLLLLSNDGDLCTRIIRPEKNVSKLYLAVLDRPLEEGAAQKMKAGILSDNGDQFRCADLTILSPRKVAIRVTEGRFHEIKRIVRACGARVWTLKRLSIGGLNLDETLAPGQIRFLTSEEINSIFSQETITHERLLSEAAQCTDWPCPRGAERNSDR